MDSQAPGMFRILNLLLRGRETMIGSSDAVIAQKKLRCFLLLFFLFYIILFSKDPFREDRATGDPADAHNSNFLHPVIYFYRHPVQGRGHNLLQIFEIILKKTSRKKTCHGMS